MAEVTGDLSALRDAPLDAAALAAGLEAFVASLAFGVERKRQMRHATGSLVALLDATPGGTLQARWERVEAERWPRWDAGEDRPWPAKNWTWGPAALVLSRAVRPGWTLLPRARLSQWLGWLPQGHLLPEVFADLRRRVAAVEWSVGEDPQRRAALLGMRLVLAGGYAGIGEITDADLKAVPVPAANGIDLLDAVLCDVGALGRTPQRGAQRRMRRARRSPAELIANSQIPERFRSVHRLYLEAYQARISDVYATTRHKHNSLAHLWAFLDERFPEIAEPAQIRRAHVVAFIPHAIARAREVQRRRPTLEPGEDRLTAHQWLTDVRCFFADVCVWATEEDSPFAAFAPPAVPLERHDLVGVGFEKARRRRAKRTLATVLDLERAVPGTRAGDQALAGHPARRRAGAGGSARRGCGGRRVLGLGAAGAAAAVRAADRGGLRADHARCAAPQPARRARLLPAARQAVEVRPRPGNPDRRRPRARDRADHRPRQAVLRQRLRARLRSLGLKGEGPVADRPLPAAGRRASEPDRLLGRARPSHGGRGRGGRTAASWCCARTTAGACSPPSS